MKPHWFGTLATLAFSQAMAGTVAGSFLVTINLWPQHEAPTTHCTAQTLRTGSSTTVRVACSENSFVSIDPVPSSPWATRNGVSQSQALRQWADVERNEGDLPGSGTVTALLIRNGIDGEGALEMLVTF